MRRLLTYATEEVVGATGAGVTIVRDGRIDVYASVGAATPLDRLQWELGEGPAVTAHRLERTVLSRDIRVDEQFPTLAAAIGQTYLPDIGKTSGVVAMPGSWDEGGPSQFTLYLNREPDEKTVAVLDRIEPMVSHAFATMAFCERESMRADQMARMVQYRRVIEQAKGILVAAVGCSAPGAFEVLDRASQRYNVKLRELAVALVEHVSKSTAEHPIDDPGHVVTPTEAARKAARQMWAAVRKAGGSSR